MNPAALELMRCPRSGQRLNLVEPRGAAHDVESGWLVSEDELNRYPIRNHVPRFVSSTNYADNFGMQWNRFSKTQLDSHSGHPISAERFWKATGWQHEDLRGRRVLDVGCGAGRFAEVALEAGAEVVALDYSSAVDACYANLGRYSNLLIVQADIFELPFADATFPFVYSLGVLQHTPDVRRAVRSLPRVIQPGGSLCVDVYEKSWKSTMLPKYWLRPLTKRVPKARLFATLETLVPMLLPVSCAVAKVPVLGRQLKRIVPVANYVGELPLNDQQQLEWSLLDTFDWLSPEYDSPQTPETIRRWLEEAGIEEIDVVKAGHLVGRGRRASR